MRTAAKLAFLVGLALTVATTAGADLPTVSLVQIGGSYDGVQAQPGDTLVLSIQYTVGDGGLTIVDPTITWGAEVASFDGGTETGFAAWSGGSVAMNPIATGDIGLVTPNQADGWEKGTTIAGGAYEPCVFGACTSLGTASFTLSGEDGVIDFGSGTIVGDCWIEPWYCWTGIPFTVVPEPARSTQLGIGLLALALLSRQRKH